MQPKRLPLAVAHADADQVLTVRLMMMPASRAPCSRLRHPHRPSRRLHDRRPTPRVRPVTHEKPRRDAMVMQDHAGDTCAGSLRGHAGRHQLFAMDGSLRLPPATYATTSAKAKPAKPADDRQIMQHDSNRMQYKAHPLR